MSDDKQVAIIITEEDLSPEAHNKLQSIEVGDRILGDKELTAAEIVYQNVPDIIARRLRKITPSDFTVAEIECKFRIIGKIPGVELNGEVTVKFKPAIG